MRDKNIPRFQGFYFSESLKIIYIKKREIII